MGRKPCCSKEMLKKGPWSIKEDTLLTTYIQKHGEGHWRSLPNKAGLLRCGKSCRLRWMNYLRPGIKRGNFTLEEDDLIVRLHSLLGNRWSLIAGRLPGRTDNEIKNYWNTHLLKKLNKAGLQTKIPKKKTNPEKTGNKPDVDNREKDRPEMTARVKVYAPRPVRLSTDRSTRNCCSFDDPVACASFNSGDIIIGNNNNININNDKNDKFFDDYMDGCDLLSNYSSPAHDALLEKVYDEYLQLLSENNCYLRDEN